MDPVNSDDGKSDIVRDIGVQISYSPGRGPDLLFFFFFCTTSCTTVLAPEYPAYSFCCW